MASKILIVGAGAMGAFVGYVLQKAGAEITYLVRENRIEQLSRPQQIYCYDDHTLKELAGYRTITQLEESHKGVFDFVVVTIDGVALRSDGGQRLVAQIGEIARGTNTKVLIGTIGLDLKPEFVRIARLSEDQVFIGGLFVVIYQAHRVTLPLHEPTDPALLAQADFAYRQATPVGFFVDSSAPAAAADFAALYNQSGISQCQVLSPQEYSTQVPAAFPIFVAWDYADWVPCSEFAKMQQLWELTTAAVQEVQRLQINGETGQKAAAQTTTEGLTGFWAQLEQMTEPMDFLGFNRFHHGGKVFVQDVEILKDCIAMGEAEGKPMIALKRLVDMAAAKRGLS